VTRSAGNTVIAQWAGSCRLCHGLGAPTAIGVPVSEQRYAQSLLPRGCPISNAGTDRDSGVYLDHGGATLTARSTIDAFHQKMISAIYGNPHSENEPARMSGEMVDQVRAKTLDFLGADPNHFDLVFVANATAAIKLVGDSFRDLAEKTRSRNFWYGYHKDAHTSLVGVRELTRAESHCFESDSEVEQWLDDPMRSISSVDRPQVSGLGLFAYPGQSNMTGRRLPLSWPRRLRKSMLLRNTYSLFDAAAYAMTAPMSSVFADPDAAPDFTCLSFYKIFGFPDLGALVVRKSSGHILTLRKYFGGGTVTMVSAIGNAWHKSKGHEASSDALGRSGAYSLHDGLEDGTLPFHSILALGGAIDVHRKLYGCMENISRHTQRLVRSLYQRVAGLHHANGQPVCRVYSEPEGFGDSRRQGPTLAINVMRADGSFVSYSEVEKVANARGIYVRSGGELFISSNRFSTSHH
jgi:molybdenum cofactor sulfurtransferase